MTLEFRLLRYTKQFSLARQYTGYDIIHALFTARVSMLLKLVEPVVTGGRMLPAN